MKRVNYFLGDIDGFLKKVLTALENDGIDVSKYELDHICYRVETQGTYNQLKTELSKVGELLSETMISGRPISTYKLNTPIIFRTREISCIELPTPKQCSLYPEGLEHAEFVIDESFDDFMNKYPAVKFDTASINKPINPDLRVEYSGLSVKFHHKPLEEVIRYEQNPSQSAQKINPKD